MQTRTPSLELLMARHKMSLLNVINEIEISKSNNVNLLVKGSNGKKEFIVRFQDQKSGDKNLVGNVVFIDGEAIIEGIDHLPKGNNLSEYLPQLKTYLHKLYGDTYKPKYC